MIRERNGKWFYRFMIGRKEFSGDTALEATERNRKGAEKREQAERVKAKVAIAQNVAEIKHISFIEAAAEFLNWCEKVEYRGKPNTWKRIRSSFNTMLTFFHDTRVTDITSGDVERFKTWRLDVLHVKEVSLRHDLHNFSLFCQYARKHKWLSGDPLEDVSIPSDADAVRDNIMTVEMESRFFARAFAVKDRNGRRNLYDLGRLMILQGPRPEELLALRQEHVNLERMELRIVAGKSRAAKRTLALCEESAELLQPRLDGKSHWVFPSDRTPGRPIGKLQGPMDKVCRESEVSCVIYDLRHTFATRMVEAGNGIETVAKILGHANLRSVMRYVHLTDDHTREAMQKYQAATLRRQLRVVGGRA